MMFRGIAVFFCIHGNRSGGGQQGWRRLTRHGRPHRIGQQVPHVASLLAARRHDGENPLHEATAVRALGAETLLAPDHGGTQHPFGGVIGRLNSRMGHNRPERIPAGQHLLAHGRDVVPRPGASVFQGRTDGRLDRLHRRLQPGPRGGAVAEGVPDGEHGFDVGQQVARPWAVAHAACQNSNEPSSSVENQLEAVAIGGPCDVCTAVR